MKTINKFSLFLIGFLLNVNCYALDMEILKEQCDEIGFKIHTPDNGKCVLRLMESDATQKRKEEIELRAYQNQQSVRAEELRQADVQRRQQAEALELQKRSIAAQEALVAEQKRNNSLQSAENWFKFAESLQPKPAQPQNQMLQLPPVTTTCRRLGLGIGEQIRCDTQ
ncbi:MAG: hypothetical protein RLZZ66_2481 [Pseudomonadota bacterium]|jgi:hypothetical protein